MWWWDLEILTWLWYVVELSQSESLQSASDRIISKYLLSVSVKELAAGNFSLTCSASLTPSDFFSRDTTWNWNLFIQGPGEEGEETDWHNHPEREKGAFRFIFWQVIYEIVQLVIVRKKSFLDENVRKMTVICQNCTSIGFYFCRYVTSIIQSSYC